MNAVIYARFSSHKQDEQSIEGQIHVCSEYAKHEGITIIDRYIDRAITGKTDARPAFQQMIKDSSKECFDIVLVYKLDRFARNRYDSATYKAKLKKNGVRVVSATENISDSPEGIILESLLEGMAEYYSAELSQKVTRGMRETASKGKSTGGKIPLGYKIVDGYYAIDTINAPAVKYIFEKYAAGETAKDIVDYLNKHGYKTSAGKNFGKSSLYSILKNEKYIGIYTYKDITCENKIPPIIDKETFDKAKIRSRANKANKQKNKAKTEYLLTPKLHCGFCKKLMVGESGTSKNGNVHNYYKCKDRKSGGTCKNNSIRQQEFEDFVVETVKTSALNDDVIKRIAKKAVEINEREKNNNSELNELYNRKKSTEKAISNLMRAIEDGIYTPSTKNRLSELEKLNAELDCDISLAKRAYTKITEDDIILFLQTLSANDTKDIKFRKLLIEMMVQSIYLYEDKMIIFYNYTNASENKEKSEHSIVSNMEKCSDNISFGDPSEIRTPDTLIKSQVLCQLS